MKKLNKNENNSERILDAADSNWVDRFCPSWSKPFLKLSRLDRPIGTWLLLLPCWWGSSLAIWSNQNNLGFDDYWIPLACALGAILMRGAGCTWNDINDRNFDSQVSRTKLRPLPSGQVSVKQAITWLLIQLIFSLLILLTFNRYAITIGFLSILPVAIYPFAKRFTWWPQFFLGICFNWGILLSFAAHNNVLGASVMILYFSGIFWTLFYDTIYAYQDSEDDALIGLKSTALLFGNNAKYWLTSFIVIIFLSMQFSFSQITKVSLISEIFIRFGAIGFCFHLVWQLWKLDIKDSDICLKLFQSNRTAGFIFLLFAIFAIASNRL